MTEQTNDYPYEYMSIEDINYKLNMFLKMIKKTGKTLPPLTFSCDSQPTGLIAYMRERYGIKPNEVSLIEEEC